MGVRESLLNTITSVADSDFVRIVTSAGASSKATVKNLFKSFESNLGAKSSFTTSDYIRVVGSDNESYKQTLSDALSFTQTVYKGANIPDGTDLLSLGIGNYYGSDVQTATYLNCPISSGNFKLTVYERTPSRLNFSLVDSTGDEYRNTQTGATAYTGWRKLPNRAEVDTLTTPTSASLTAGTNITFATGFHNAATKVGRVVTVEFALTASDAIASGAQLATVPSGYRPSKQVRAVCYHTTGYGRFAIEPSGKVQAYSAMASGQSVIGTITYIV